MKLREQKKKNGNIEAGSKRAVKRGVIDGFQVSVEKQLKSEERVEKWAEMRCAPNKTEKKETKKKSTVRVGGQKGSGERAESRIQVVKRPNPFVTQRLISIFE